VLTTGCDKTTPASLMAGRKPSTPAIVASRPRLNGWYGGERTGSGTGVGNRARTPGCGEIGYDGSWTFGRLSAPSSGHCNTMGTATTMNSLARSAFGMSCR